MVRTREPVISQPSGCRIVYHAALSRYVPDVLSLRYPCPGGGRAVAAVRDVAISLFICDYIYSGCRVLTDALIRESVYLVLHTMAILPG